MVNFASVKLKTLRNLFSSGAAVHQCSLGKPVWKSPEIHAIAVVSFFVNLQDCSRCFPVNFVKFLRTPFYGTPPVAASEPIIEPW